MPRAKRLPPRFADYPDRGCWLAPSCLECPLPACRHDLPPDLLRKVLARLRAEEQMTRPTASAPVAALGERV